MPNKERRPSTDGLARRRVNRRWRTDTDDHQAIRRGWRAWLASIGQGYFGADSHRQESVSVITEGMAQGLAWLVSEAALGRSVRGRRRVSSANRKADFGPGRDVHSGLVEGIANAALGMGRDWLTNPLRELHLPIAAQTIVAAAADALEDEYAGARGPSAVRRLFLMEIQERLDSRIPWLAAVAEYRRESIDGASNDP